jgi:hypothetical protein
MLNYGPGMNFRSLVLCDLAPLHVILQRRWGLAAAAGYR